MCLSNLSIGCTAIIQYIDDKCDNKKRLLELGFTPNSIIIPLFTNMSGSLTAYWIKGCVMALRKCDVQNIFVSLEGDCNG